MASSEILQFDESQPDTAIVRPGSGHGIVKRVAAILITTGSLIGLNPIESTAYVDQVPSGVDMEATPSAESLQGYPAPSPGSETAFYLPDGVTSVINFTVTEVPGPGFFQLRGNGLPAKGSTSNLNASTAGETIAGMAFVKPVENTNGVAYIYTQNGGHEIIDRSGFFIKGALDDVPDERLLDTRPNGILSPNSVTEINGRPDSTAVVSLVATDVEKDSYIQVLSSPDQVPGAYSNHNANKGKTSAKLVLIKFDAEGKAWIYNQNKLSLVADLQVYFANEAIIDITDTRILDTRLNGGLPAAANSITKIKGIPNSDAIISVLGVDPLKPSYVQVVNSGDTIGEASNLNLQPGEVRGNLAFVHFDENGEAGLFTNGSTHFVVDLLAYMEPGYYVSQKSERVLDTRDGTRKEPPPVPVELTPQPACNKAAWVEQYENQSTFEITYKYAIYDLATNSVQRIDVNSANFASLPTSFEIDPSSCQGDLAVYFSQNSAVPNGKRVARRKLKDDVVTVLSTQFDGIQNVTRPDGLFDSFAFIQQATTSFDQVGQRMTYVNTVGNPLSIFVEDYSISDSGTMYGDISKYNKYTPSGVFLGEMFKVQLKLNPIGVGTKRTFSYEYPTSSTERFSKIQINSEGTRAFVLRADNGGKPILNEVLPLDSLQTSPVQFKPIVPPVLNNATIRNFRAIGPATVVATTDTSDGNGGSITQTVVFNVDTGAYTIMSPQSGTHSVSVLM